MPEFNIEGTVKSISKTEKKNKSTEQEYAQVTIVSNAGETVNIKASPLLLNGLKPEEPVLITIKRSQQTIAEAMRESRTKEEPKKSKKK